MQAARAVAPTRAQQRVTTPRATVARASVARGAVAAVRASPLVRGLATALPARRSLAPLPSKLTTSTQHTVARKVRRAPLPRIDPSPTPSGSAKWHAFPECVSCTWRCQWHVADCRQGCRAKSGTLRTPARLVAFPSRGDLGDRTCRGRTRDGTVTSVAASQRRRSHRLAPLWHRQRTSLTCWIDLPHPALVTAAASHGRRRRPRPRPARQEAAPARAGQHSLLPHLVHRHWSLHRVRHQGAHHPEALLADQRGGGCVLRVVRVRAWLPPSPPAPRHRMPQLRLCLPHPSTATQPRPFVPSIRLPVSSHVPLSKP